MSEALITAIVGFGSALLGAVAGHMGALQIDSRRESRRRRATIKGLVQEITLNAEAVHVGIADLQQQLPLSDEFWREVRLVAAVYLDDDTYDAVVTGYSMLPRARQTLERYQRMQDKEYLSFLVKYAGEILKPAQTMLEQRLNAEMSVWERLLKRAKEWGGRGRKSKAAPNRRGESKLPNANTHE
ncbi:MAG: hypothetical protein WBF66_08750 [Dehalococcoidia bacterium]